MENEALLDAAEKGRRAVASQDVEEALFQAQRVLTEAFGSGGGITVPEIVDGLWRRLNGK